MPDAAIPDPGALSPEDLKAINDAIDASRKLAEEEKSLGKAMKDMGGEAAKAAAGTKALAQEQEKQSTVTKRNAAQTLALVASYNALAFATVRTTKTLTDTVRGQVAYRLEQQRTASVIMTGIKTQEAQVAALQKMQNQLKLTRREAQEFFKVWRAGAPLGLDPKEITQITDELQKMLGIQAGRAMARRVPELARAVGGGGVVQQLRGRETTEMEFIEGLGDASFELGEVAATLRAARGAPVPVGALQQKSDLIAAADMQIDAVRGFFADFSTSLFNSRLFITGPTALSALAVGLGGLGTLWRAAQTVQQSTLTGIQINTGLAAGRAGVSGIMPTAGAPAAAKGGGFLRRAGRFVKGKATPLAIIAGLTAELGGGALRGAGEEEMRRTGGAAGAGKVRGGAAIQAGGGIAGMAGTGALLGSMFGPLGTAVGAIGGAAVGIFSEWGNITKALFGVEDEMEKARKLDKKILTAVQIRANELVLLKAQTQELPGLLAAAWKGAEQGIAQFRAGAAEAALQLAIPAADPGKITELTRQIARGKQAQLAQFLRVEDVDNRILELNRTIATETDPLKVRFAEMDLASLQARKALGEAAVAEAFSVAALADKLNAALNRNLEARKTQLGTVKTEIDTFGLIMGDTSRLTTMLDKLGELRDAEAVAAKENLEKIKERRRIAIAAAGENEAAIQAAELAFGIGEAAIQQRVAQAAQTFVKGVTDTVERVVMTAFEQRAFRIPEAQRALAEARLAEARTRGVAPGMAGQLAGAVAVQARAAATFALSTQERDLDDARKKAGDQIDKLNIKEKTGKELALALETKRLILLNLEEDGVKRQVKDLGLLATAREAEATAATTALKDEMRIMEVSGARLDAEKRMAEITGASFQTQHSILQDMAGLDQQRLSNLNAQLVESTRIKGPWHPDTLRLQTQAAQKEADIVARTVGLQRDFLDKALGRGFGMMAGTRFQPTAPERFALGEHMRVGGLAIGGGQLGAREQARSMAFGGVNLPMGRGRGGADVFAPGGFGGQGLREVPAGPAIPSFQRFPGGAAGAAAPGAAAPGAAQAKLMDVSGKITIDINLNTDKFNAAVSEKVLLMAHAGKIVPGPLGAG